MHRVIPALMCCCLVSSALAAERLVPGQYTSIQQAIDAAQDGDVVVVQPGTYRESIRFRGKAITVRASDLSGLQAMQKTTIDGSRDRSSCVVFDQGETPESVLEGFTLSQGRGGSVLSEAGAFDAGGGVLCINSSPTIRRCWIIACDASYGGGIAMFGACQARIVSCLITHNRARRLGAAVLIRNEVAPPAGMPVMRGRTRASSTTVSSGGGLSTDALQAGGGPALINCTIVDNETSGEPGPWPYRYDVDCWDTRPVIVNTIIYGSEPSLLISDPSLVSHCCIRETHLFAGSYENSQAPTDFAHMVNTFGGFPGFAKIPPGPTTWENVGAEYRLDVASPCVNAGSAVALEFVQHDIDGEPRLMGARIDIGVDEVQPMLVVTSPRAGDVWPAGSARRIHWESHVYEEAVDLLFSEDGGNAWLPIARAVPNSGSHQWVLPTAVDSNSCVVSVAPRVPDANILQVDSGRFTIHPDSTGPIVASEWPSLGGGFGRSGLSESQGPDCGRVEWEFKIAEASLASITIGFDERVHIACEGGKLHTLDASGRLLWTCAMASGALSSPTIGPDGSVFVGTEDGTLYAIDVSGQTRWTYRTGGAIYSSPAVAANGDVYVGSTDGAIYALASNGSELWRFRTKGPGPRLKGAVFASPSIGTDGSVYVAGFYDPNLCALDPADGSVKWICRFGQSSGQSKLTPWPFASPVVAEDGTVYQVLLHDTHLYAIEPQDGTIRWSTDLTDPCSTAWPAQGPKRNGDGWSEPALGPDGTIYVSTNDPCLRAIDPNGCFKWIVPLGGVGAFTLTVDKRGYVYAAGEDSVIYVVHPDGVLLTWIPVDGSPTFPVIAAEDVLIVPDSTDYSLLITDLTNTVLAISCPWS